MSVRLVLGDETASAGEGGGTSAGATLSSVPRSARVAGASALLGDGDVSGRAPRLCRHAHTGARLRQVTAGWKSRQKKVSVEI